MKKRKLLRNVSLVALSALMVGGTAMAFTACGGSGGGSGTISVYIFCNTADAETNERICNDAIAQYNAANGTNYTISFDYNPDQDTYFDEISNRMTSGNNIPDIMYLSPKNVATYAGLNRVLDLSPYLLASETGIQGTTSIWEKSLAFYAAYRGTNGIMVNASQAVYQDAQEAANNDAGFYDGNNKLGIYGLPKDYSNFSMGYNRNFFTDELKEAYTTTVASEAGRSVVSHIYTSTDLNAAKELTHTGGNSMRGTITYAATGDYTNPYTGETMHAVAGQDAPIINIGVPTTYRPFNFYQYTSYQQAIQGGDPIALATQYYTNGQGYTVTIPGFPDEKIDISGSEYDDYKDPDAIYDTDTAYITYTYAEYGALSWALTYYLNTYAWDNGQTDPMNGYGGKWYSDAQRYQNVYGGEQYENALGPNLYVLPWLYSNDAAYIDSNSTYTQNNDANTGGNWGNTDIKDWAGTKTETVQKRTLDGGYRDALVQPGMDSQNFIETYGAFHNHGSVWNANSGQAGDGLASDKGSLSGWVYFRAGSAIFYGAGTWDFSTRNNSDIETLDAGEMPAPVSEKLALYSTVRNAYYDRELQVYANDTTKAKGVGNDAGTATGSTGDYAQAANPQARVFTEDEITMNQLKRQDKWGARMDSVGYAASYNLANDSEKAEAAANVIMALTIDEQSQVTLTYGGAQLPNVKRQCEDFLNYNDDAYNQALEAEGRENAFSGMITPEGDAEGNDVWDEYYQLARDMAAAATGSDSNKTVAQYLSDKTINGEAAKYDTQYAEVRLRDFDPGDGSTYLAYSMRVLRLVNFRKEDRDLCIRMQYGLNSARDQLMYTTGTAWIAVLDQSTASTMLAYINQGIGATDSSGTTAKTRIDFATEIQTQMYQTGSQYNYLSPAVLCVQQVHRAQTLLEERT